jgi:hypothetical protein
MNWFVVVFIQTNSFPIQYMNDTKDWVDFRPWNSRY